MRIKQKVVLGIVGIFMLFGSNSFMKKSFADEEKTKATEVRIINEEEAVRIAMSNSPNWKLQKVELDNKLSGKQYEVVLINDSQEKDFIIDALTGEILSFETDKSQESLLPNVSINISFEDAVKIAMEESKTGEFKKIELERKKGHLFYAVDIEDGLKVKEYRIDAETGEVLSARVDL